MLVIYGLCKIYPISSIGKKELRNHALYNNSPVIKNIRKIPILKKIKSAFSSTICFEEFNNG